MIVKDQTESYDFDSLELHHMIHSTKRKHESKCKGLRNSTEPNTSDIIRQYSEDTPSLEALIDVCFKIERSPSDYHLKC